MIIYCLYPYLNYLQFFCCSVRAGIGSNTLKEPDSRISCGFQKMDGWHPTCTKNVWLAKKRWMPRQPNVMVTEAGGQHRIRTPSEGGASGWVAHKHNCSCREPEGSAVEAEAEVSTVQEGWFWTGFILRVSVRTVQDCTGLYRTARFLLRQPCRRNYLPFFLEFQWFN